MKRFDGKLLLGWIIALAMVVVGTTVPVLPAFAHPTVEHAVALDDHGHSHDVDDIEYEPSGGHTHPHTGDHTHDVPGLPPSASAGLRSAQPERGPHLHAESPRNLPLSLDRPPKPSARA